MDSIQVLRQMDIIFNVESGEARKRGKPLNGVDFKARTPVHLKYKRGRRGNSGKKESKFENNIHTYLDKSDHLDPIIFLACQQSF